MNSKRVFLLMLGIVSVLTFANVGAIYMGNQLLQNKAKKLQSLKLDGKVLDDQQNSLAQTKKDVQTYSSLEQIAKIVVPQDKDQAEAVREIVKIAGDNGIVLGSITFPISTLGQVAPKTSSSSSDSQSSDSTSTSKTKSTAPPVTQVKAVDGIPGVYTLDINIQQDPNKPISYAQFINFLTGLEQNRRTSQVTSINVTPNTADRNKLSFTLTVQAYIKP